MKTIKCKYCGKIYESPNEMHMLRIIHLSTNCGYTTKLRLCLTGISLPIAFKDITTIMPIYTQPFLPAVEEKYLTSIAVVQDNDVKVVLNGAEWIHPDGCSMGRVDISTNTYMVAMNRIASLTVVTDKKKTVMAGVAIGLTDGSAYLLTEGVEKTKDE